MPNDSCGASSNYDYAFDAKWHCAEWHFEAAKASFQFFIDGQELSALAFSGLNGTGGKCNAEMVSSGISLALGEIFYQQPDSPLTSWIDDVAIDDGRIGCQ